VTVQNPTWACLHIYPLKQTYLFSISFLRRVTENKRIGIIDDICTRSYVMFREKRCFSESNIRLNRQLTYKIKGLLIFIYSNQY